MKGEINREWYCSTGRTLKNVIGHDVKCFGLENEICDGCLFKHRKHPTPPQFKEEYGEEWKGSGYALNCASKKYEWYGVGNVREVLKWKKKHEAGHIVIVCACTPWGKPPDGWRPE